MTLKDYTTGQLFKELDKRGIKDRFLVTCIDSCSSCDNFDDNGGCKGTMCDHPKQLRHTDDSWVLLDDTIDPYEEIHPDCPALKGIKNE